MLTFSIVLCKTLRNLCVWKKLWFKLWLVPFFPFLCLHVRVFFLQTNFITSSVKSFLMMQVILSLLILQNEKFKNVIFNQSRKETISGMVQCY